MIRLRPWLVASVLAAAVSAPADDPHLNEAYLPAGCPTCHRGHGVSRSPMLPGPQAELCLSCHGTRADIDRQVARGQLSPAARPALVGRALQLPSTHPLTRGAVSSQGTRTVTCTSCHSAHRGMTERPSATPAGRPLVSPKQPDRLEYELCESCHGSGGSASSDLTDISRLLSPSNPSYHPVEAPAQERSASTVLQLQGRQINCTDCHGNSEPGDGRGPHGSRERPLLRAGYATMDGTGESASAFALCYRCHSREWLLGGRGGGWHQRHIVDVRASCATCHDPHGSVQNRALIRFGLDVRSASVSPSLKTGRLEFVSETGGQGLCYLTCHGRDHAPEAFGGAVPLPTRSPRP